MSEEKRRKPVAEAWGDGDGASAGNSGIFNEHAGSKRIEIAGSKGRRQGSIGYMHRCRHVLGTAWKGQVLKLVLLRMTSVFFSWADLHTRARAQC